MPEIHPAPGQEPREFFAELLELAGDQRAQVQVMTHREQAVAWVPDDVYDRWAASNGSAPANDPEPGASAPGPEPDSKPAKKRRA